MKYLGLGVVFCCATNVAAHGYVKTVNIDNYIWPGFDPHQDPKLGAKRVVFSDQQNDEGTGPTFDPTSPDLTCDHAPAAPALIAPVRAGSNIDFHWTQWLTSHKGPLQEYMARYEGDINKVDVTTLNWFKTGASGLDANGTWATDRMIAAGGLWNSTIPYDILPGTYVLRHELLALHFATADSNYKNIPGGRISPQFYVSCYNLNVTGTGTAEPPTVKFPGAYKKTDPGLNFDIFNHTKVYPMPGPEVYQSKLQPSTPLTPNNLTVVSPMGNATADAAYYQALSSEIALWGNITGYFQSIGG